EPQLREGARPQRPPELGPLVLGPDVLRDEARRLAVHRRVGVDGDPDAVVGEEVTASLEGRPFELDSDEVQGVVGRVAPRHPVAQSPVHPARVVTELDEAHLGQVRVVPDVIPRPSVPPAGRRVAVEYLVDERLELGGRDGRQEGAHLVEPAGDERPRGVLRDRRGAGGVARRAAHQAHVRGAAGGVPQEGVVRLLDGQQGRGAVHVVRVGRRKGVLHLAEPAPGVARPSRPDGLAPLALAVAHSAAVARVHVGLALVRVGERRQAGPVVALRPPPAPAGGRPAQQRVGRHAPLLQEDQVGALARAVPRQDRARGLVPPPRGVAEAAPAVPAPALDGAGEAARPPPRRRRRPAPRLEQPVPPAPPRLEPGRRGDVVHVRVAAPRGGGRGRPG
ncbi:hypothetical protein THAOC_10981, partial [Thalassiosira oceanica]